MSFIRCFSGKIENLFIGISTAPFTLVFTTQRVYWFVFFQPARRTRTVVNDCERVRILFSHPSVIIRFCPRPSLAINAGRAVKWRKREPAEGPARRANGPCGTRLLPAGRFADVTCTRHFMALYRVSNSSLSA